MSDGDLPAPAPAVNPETKPFWEATTEDQLLIQECGSCSMVYYYPRARCPNCFADTTAWIEASGRGHIYSYSITYGGVGGEYAEATPYVLAYVELEEGPRMLTNIVGLDEDEFELLEIGQPVKLTFTETDHESGYKLPRFIPE